MKNILHRLRYNPLSKSNANKKKGVALLLAITSLILMVYIATEVTKDSALEYVVNSQEINRIKAYYAARNSLDVALLRIKTFQQVSQMNLPDGFAQQVDEIWKFPFVWPLPLLDGMSSMEKDESDEKSKEALFEGVYEQFISDEGSKIDINDLASPSKVLQEVTSLQILNIFNQYMDSNDEFKDKYQNYNFTELINRMADWISSTNTSKNGGDKRAAFSSLGDIYPPNRGFRTLDELRLIPGMNEEFFNLLAPQITIYGSKAINPNLATARILKSLDKDMTDEAIAKALERRENPEDGGPFKGKNSEECRKDFKSFVEGYGVRLSPEFDKIPFTCDKVSTFKIVATGKSGSGKGAAQKKITAIVMDVAGTASKIKSYLEAERKENNPNESGQQQGAPGPKSDTQKKEALPKGPPRIVYWSEI